MPEISGFIAFGAYKMYLDQPCHTEMIQYEYLTHIITYQISRSKVKVTSKG